VAGRAEQEKRKLLKKNKLRREPRRGGRVGGKWSKKPHVTIGGLNCKSTRNSPREWTSADFH